MVLKKQMNDVKLQIAQQKLRVQLIQAINEKEENENLSYIEKQTVKHRLNTINSDNELENALKQTGSKRQNILSENN